jgi:hypothetical protein
MEKEKYDATSMYYEMESFLFKNELKWYRKALLDLKGLGVIKLNLKPTKNEQG